MRGELEESEGRLKQFKDQRVSFSLRIQGGKEREGVGGWGGINQKAYGPEVHLHTVCPEIKYREGP